MNWAKAALAILPFISLPSFACFGNPTYPACDGSFCFGFNWKTVSVEELGGFDPAVRADGGLPPLYQAISFSDDPNVIEKLINDGGFAIAARTPQFEFYLVCSYEELEASTDLSLAETPLTHAVIYNDNPEIVDALIRAGARIVPGSKGPNPLAAAAANNPNPEVAARLLEAGADVNGSGFTGIASPLQSAVSANNIEMIDLLLQAGAKVNMPSARGGLFPIHFASSIESIELLVGAGANVNSVSDRLATPLIAYLSYPIEHVSAAVVTGYLEAGADIAALDNVGQTPFDVACEKGQSKDITSLLAANSEQADRKCLSQSDE